MIIYSIRLKEEFEIRVLYVSGTNGKVLIYTLLVEVKGVGGGGGGMLSMSAI